MNRSPFRRGFLLIPLALALGWLALSPQARATCQEGCLTNNNTVLGDAALLNNSGTDNTAIGFEALFNNEFLKEHQKVEQLEATVAKLTAAVERVSAALEARKSSPQIVLNNQ